MANEVVEAAAAEAEGEEGGGNWSVFTNMMMIMLVMQLVKFNKPDSAAGPSNITHAIEQQLMVTAPSFTNASHCLTYCTLPLSRCSVTATRHLTASHTARCLSHTALPLTLLLCRH